MTTQATLLTIDFFGLCAFVANCEDRQEVSRIDVLVLDTSALSGGTRIPHDPLVVYEGADDQGQGDFLTAEGGADRKAFADARGRNIEVWDIKGKSLQLDCASGGTGRAALSVRRSFRQVLAMRQLACSGAVKSCFQPSSCLPKGVAASLSITHGTVSGCRWTPDEWGLAPKSKTPTKFGAFRQAVRWEVTAEATGSHGPVTLSDGSNASVEFRLGAHIAISNLCPLPEKTPDVSEDILAYYPLSPQTIDPKDRKILYRASKIFEDEPPDWRRPVSEACPPLTGYWA